MGAGGGLVAQGEPVWKPWRSRASLGKVGRKQLGWEERLGGEAVEEGHVLQRWSCVGSAGLGQ